MAYNLKYLVLIIALVVSPVLLSQESTEDSVRIYLSRSIDTNAIKKLNDWNGQLIHRSDPTVSESIQRTILSHAVRLNFLKGQAKAYNLLGVINYYKNDYDSAGFYYKKGLELNTKIGYKKGIAAGYSNLAAIDLIKGDLTNALQDQLKGLAIQEEILDKLGIIKSCYGVSETYSALRNFDKALEYGNKALKKAKEFNISSENGAIYLFLGITYSQMNNLEKAVECYSKAIEANTEQRNVNGVIFSYNNLGGVYMERKMSDSAGKYFTLAKDLIQYSEDKQAIASTCVNYGSYLNSVKKFREALPILEKGRALLEEMHQKKGLPETYGALAEATAGTGDYKKAYEMYKLHALYKDSALNNDVQKKISDLLVKFEREKNDKEVLLLKKDKDLQTQASESQRHQKYLILVAAAIIVILLCIFIVVMVNRFNLTRKQKNIIELKEKETARQKEVIEEKQKEIIDSINYAKRIQHSLLASEQLLAAHIPSHFIFFHPKDIVSGDFYWGAELSNGDFALVTADSTGHGVPGAIMSMLNIACLNEAVGKRITSADKILFETRKSIIEHLSNDGSNDGGKDGMDCSLVCLDPAHTVLKCAAANNPVWIVRNNSVMEIKPDKMPVGKHDKDQQIFTLHEIPLEKNDMIYTFTDGYADQFGGPKGKKFKYKPLEDFLLSISQLSLPEQQILLDKQFREWKGNLEQVDDVLVIGIRI